MKLPVYHLKASTKKKKIVHYKLHNNWPSSKNTATVLQKY